MKKKSYNTLQVTPTIAVLKMKLNIKGAMTAAGWGGHFSPSCSNYFTNITTTNVSPGHETISQTQRYSKTSAN